MTTTGTNEFEFTLSMPSPVAMVGFGGGEGVVKAGNGSSKFVIVSEEPKSFVVMVSMVLASLLIVFAPGLFRF